LKYVEDQHKTLPFTKVEKPQRNISTKKLSADVNNKHVKVNINQNESKIHKEEKAIVVKVDNSDTVQSSSSDVSDNQEYEDDFEVKKNIYINILYINF